jgi:hypothetical protein
MGGVFGGLRTLFGPTADEDLAQTGDCMDREYPIVQAKPEHRKTPPERLLEIVRELCFGKRLAGATD